MGTTDPFARAMPLRHGSRKCTTVAPPCGAVGAAATLQDAPAARASGWRGSDPRSKPEPAPSRAASGISAPVWDAGRRLGQGRMTASSCVVENAEPPVFSIFFDPPSLSDDPFLSTAAKAQILAEADVSRVLRGAARAPRERPPPRGEGRLRSPRMRQRGAAGNQCLSGFSCV
jgi:hypothetical protein